ncbi:MAG: toll/interleukin-1 receptor domain-containing protein [Anaerolineales bacterium]|nr:toll/interleukin-1 receptor domain-containing protein [Anaerolineales bacterium]
MSEYEQAVFISYAWGEETNEREAIVNQLDHSLQKRGLKIIRDKRDLGYKGMIRQFMERIGEGDCIIVVLSDKYLRSKNCMYELVEIAKNKDFTSRVFPIVLPDAKIYDAKDRIEYKKYWKQKKEDLNREILSLGDLSNITGIAEELDDYDRFGDEFDKLTAIFKNMNTLSPDILRESDFQQVYDALISRMASTWDSTSPQSKSNTKKEKKTMDNNDGKVSANNNSTSVGSISIGGKMSGNLVIGNNNKVTNTVNNGISAAEIEQLFDQLYSEIDKRAGISSAVKEDLKADVQEIQTAVTQAVEKNEKVEESFVSRKFRSIARMAPDILDVVIATIGNPLAGLGVAAKKIADKAKEESKG